MIRNVGLGSAVATGALFILISCLSAAVFAKQEKIEQTDGQNLPLERVRRCRFQLSAGPEMVIIASDQFQQGSEPTEAGHSEDEAPRHQVTIIKPFALGRCEVTVAEFRLFVNQTGYQTDAEKLVGCFNWNSDIKKFAQVPGANWKSPGFKQNENHPVTCVSWNDALAYIEWLNDYLELPEKTYRLATESEWEFAVRASTSSAHFWGTQSQCASANALDATAKESALFADKWNFSECIDGFIFTAPVASFKANHWGLFDMSGNVWEWVQDCWHEDYNGAPEDGRAWLEVEKGDCERRSVRGGGWLSLPADLRSANRDRDDADGVYSDVGFRLARTL